MSHFDCMFSEMRKECSCIVDGGAPAGEDSLLDAKFMTDLIRKRL